MALFRRIRLLYPRCQRGTAAAFDTSKLIHVESAGPWKHYLHPHWGPSAETKQSSIFYTDKRLLICRLPYLVRGIYVH